MYSMTNVSQKVQVLEAIHDYYAENKTKKDLYHKPTKELVKGILGVKDAMANRVLKELLKEKLIEYSNLSKRHGRQTIWVYKRSIKGNNFVKSYEA